MGYTVRLDAPGIARSVRDAVGALVPGWRVPAAGGRGRARPTVTVERVALAVLGAFAVHAVALVPAELAALGTLAVAALGLPVLLPWAAVRTGTRLLVAVEER